MIHSCVSYSQPAVYHAGTLNKNNTCSKSLIKFEFWTNIYCFVCAWNKSLPVQVYVQIRVHHAHHAGSLVVIDSESPLVVHDCRVRPPVSGTRTGEEIPTLMLFGDEETSTRTDLDLHTFKLKACRSKSKELKPLWSLIGPQPNMPLPPLLPVSHFKCLLCVCLSVCSLGWKCRRSFMCRAKSHRVFPKTTA